MQIDNQGFGCNIYYDGTTAMSGGSEFELGNWKNEAFRTVDFGSTEQTVSDDFYYILTENATQQASEEPTDTATITYNGVTIASLIAGQTATLPCKGKKMKSDIVVTAPAESGESGGSASQDLAVLVSASAFEATLKGYYTISGTRTDGKSYGTSYDRFSLSTADYKHYRYITDTLHPVTLTIVVEEATVSTSIEINNLNVSEHISAPTTLEYTITEPGIYEVVLSAFNFDF